MTIFTCEENFEAMMTCIYDAWASKNGHANVRLELEPVEQQELFCEYISVRSDSEKSGKVIRSIKQKISFEAYRQVYLAAMCEDPKRLDDIYRFLIAGFACGHRITEQLTWPEVMRILELSRKTASEAHRFREFVRFSALDQKVYVAHIQPKSDITAIVAEHFADRMPSEQWMILDDGRKIAAVHPKDGSMYMRKLTEEEFGLLSEAGDREDRYTDLWREFFRSIAIEARENPRCQKNLLPLWYRRNMTEFIKG